MKPAARRRARECAVQALYSWQLSQNDIADVEYQFLAEQDVKDVDVLYFRELLAGVATDRKSTRLNSSHQIISYAVFCLKKHKRALRV
mgnify:CR=1 FL=1